jgi:hypothetical protein
MKKLLVPVLSLAVVGILALSFPANAKTATECEKEWQANKADNQAKKITEKAYVEKCRADSAAAEKKAKPAAKKEEKAAAPKKEEKAAAPMAPAPAPKSASAAPTGANQYAMETLAKAHCPRDTVVWANLDSKIYHFSGHKDYGHTKIGAYMCEKDATGQGIRAAKNEKHP